MHWSLLTPETAFDPSDGALLAALEEATLYVAGQPWCPPILERHLGHFEPGKLALFLFRFEQPAGGADEALWVVVGDLPPAHFVTDEAPTPALALHAYCTLMEEWAEAVRSGASLKDCFPVDAPVNARTAKQLGLRMDYIREQILPRVPGANGED
jgi:hypothetical protein